MHDAIADLEILVRRDRVEILNRKLALQHLSAALDSELRSLRIRLPTPQSDAATLREASAPEPAFHLRLVPQSAGYALSESAGPPPRAGERVDVDDKRFRVARVGRSPLPSDERPCAFLLLVAEQDPSSPRPPESMRG